MRKRRNCDDSPSAFACRRQACLNVCSPPQTRRGACPQGAMTHDTVVRLFRAADPIPQRLQRAGLTQQPPLSRLPPPTIIQNRSGRRVRSEAGQDQIVWRVAVGVSAAAPRTRLGDRLCIGHAHARHAAAARAAAGDQAGRRQRAHRSSAACLVDRVVRLADRSLPVVVLGRRRPSA